MDLGGEEAVVVKTTWFNGTGLNAVNGVSACHSCTLFGICEKLVLRSNTHSLINDSLAEITPLRAVTSLSSHTEPEQEQNEFSPWCNNTMPSLKYKQRRLLK
jgi:hypothetical protein